jgi:hypothetical protein
MGHLVITAKTTTENAHITPIAIILIVYTPLNYHGPFGLITPANKMFSR